MQISFPVKATAKNVHHAFTGNNGLYASFQFDKDSVEALALIATRLGLPFDPSDMHVTVMYSKQAPEYGALYLLESDLGAVGSAVITGIDHWVGHDERTYIVLRLQSEQLAQMNAKLVRCGAMPTFIPYVPHVTLGKQEGELSEELKARIAEVNKDLAGSGTTLKLIDYKFGDLDG